ncbi:hypothetical protein Vadar_004921 [Vaccinium darrowii]|uniref:Uncharacterized protein n=1 Tax=Vaccinium darrowii TaxID=229202 RepID=A0ACB7ZH11_9ERIC|nr:hypothetical protein Vadar_004921 [Vaccinium darrowii]
MLLLFLSVLLTLIYCSHGDLIADTCRKTQYPLICISTLRSNPHSRSADVKGLVRFILKAALGKANTILNLANDLLKKTKDPILRQSLDTCISVYQDALDEIPIAIENVGKNNVEASDNASATFVDADTCEESFSNSPFAADNKAVKQLAVVAEDIIGSLG